MQPFPRLWKETWSCSNAMLMTRDEKKGGGGEKEEKGTDDQREMAARVKYEKIRR